MLPYSNYNEKNITEKTHVFSTFELDVGVSMQLMFKLYKTEECLI